MGTSSTDLTSLLQALHVFAVVTYFGGTFHLVRLYVAHREAMSRWEPDRTILLRAFKSLEAKALYFLVWPALVTALGLSGWLLWQHPGMLMGSFVQVMLGYTAVLMGYHLLVHSIHGRLKRGENMWSSIALRLFAQGATGLLFILVLVLFYRDEIGWTGGIIGLIVIGVIVLYGVFSPKAKQPAPPDA